MVGEWNRLHFLNDRRGGKMVGEWNELHFLRFASVNFWKKVKVSTISPWASAVTRRSRKSWGTSVRKGGWLKDRRSRKMVGFNLFNSEQKNVGRRAEGVDKWWENETCFTSWNLQMNSQRHEESQDGKKLDAPLEILTSWTESKRKTVFVITFQSKIF